MNYICTRSFKAHNNKKYKEGQVITLHELNTLTYFEKTNNFKLYMQALNEGIGNDLNIEL